MCAFLTSYTVLSLFLGERGGERGRAASAMPLCGNAVAVAHDKALWAPEGENRRTERIPPKRERRRMLNTRQSYGFRCAMSRNVPLKRCGSGGFDGYRAQARGLTTHI